MASRGGARDIRSHKSAAGVALYRAIIGHHVLARIFYRKVYVLWLFSLNHYSLIPESKNKGILTFKVHYHSYEAHSIAIIAELLFGACLRLSVCNFRTLVANMHGITRILMQLES